MNTETMTLRKALGQKKLLDKQIMRIAEDDFVVAVQAGTEIFDGLPIKEWEKKTEANYQALNDKIRRREALAKAIMEANVNNYVELPKFVSLDGRPSGTEKVSFASAIARKAYYQKELNHIIDMISFDISNAAGDFEEIANYCEQTIKERMATEFGNSTNVGAKAREEREATLRKQYEAVYLDPVGVVGKIREMKENIEEYLENIDAILGNATEMTTITVTY